MLTLRADPHQDSISLSPSKLHLVNTLGVQWIVDLLWRSFQGHDSVLNIETLSPMSHRTRPISSAEAVRYDHHSIARILMFP